MSADDLVIRPITGPAEIALFNRLDYTLNHELADDLAEGRRRPEWMWLAQRGDTVLARVAWWSRPGGDAPVFLDIFDLDDSEPDVARRLLAAAFAAVVPTGGQPPEYGRYVPGDWRDDPAARRAVETRMALLSETGAKLTVERLRLQWGPGTAVPPAASRLAFRPADDPAELIDLMTRVLDGTLDHHSRADLATMPARDTATAQLHGEFASFTSPRDWWQIAQLPGTGEPVGFVIAARNSYHPIIAYLGVLPEHRGRGYVDAILAEGTRVLAAHGAAYIRAATDLDNEPMADAFARAGYATFERAINMAWH
ncbi:N-acetyltransferase [Catellatospora methionotrophica]|uniref:N-acetyltransferase n=1 Tax=Catellatospora methionotrophica TaxID=121620 RepID=A0A8J3PK75_9ACTN|nr:GNAT family N-acetyltransferase [Catellatospora methionotrophica]GIG18176.1 N-acetyltransferase [Catellatospora methionotrophica]